MEPTASSPESSKVKSGAKVNQYPMNTITVVMANVSQSTRWKSGATGAGGRDSWDGTGPFAAVDAGEGLDFRSDLLGPFGFSLSALMSLDQLAIRAEKEGTLEGEREVFVHSKSGRAQWFHSLCRRGA